MISLAGVTKRFPDGTLAVDHLSLEVVSGGVLALLGSSGSGKTTTLRMINRLIEPTGGVISIDGRDVRSMDLHELRRGIGYVIQQAGLFPHRTVLDNVMTVPKLLRWDRGRARTRAHEMLELVGLDPSLAKRYPSQLSGGQQQRVGVARALAADPPILLMDEPFGAVDPIVRVQLQQEFLRLQQELAKTVVFVTHDVDEAIQLATEVAVLRPGGVLAELGSPADVLAAPADEFVADFLGPDRAVKLLGLRSASELPRRALHEPVGGWSLDAVTMRWTGEGRAVDAATVSVDLTARHALDRSLAHPTRAVVVVDASGRPLGITTFDDVGGGGVVIAAGPQWSGPQLAGNWDVIFHYGRVHIAQTALSVTIAAVVALVLGYVAHRSSATYTVLLGLTSMIYAVPSLALFALLWPFFGVTTDQPVIVAMVLYSLAILLRSLVEGLRAVPPATVTAAQAMGYGSMRRFLTVELPIAIPTVVAGLRLATVSTVSLLSVGGLIGKGGLGRLFRDGFDRRIDVEIWAGLLAIVVIALAADVLLLVLGRALTPWTRLQAAANEDGDCDRDGDRNVSDILDGFRWVFTADNWWGSNGILRALLDHLYYSVVGLTIAALIGLPIGLLVGHTGRGRFVSTWSATALRALPTIAVVMLLFRWRPISIYPVLGALIVLAIPPIVLNTAAGIDAVDRDARDAARGLGLAPMQVLVQVELPCALPLVLAGLRSAANQVIATATIAGFGIGLGGLGTFLFSGFGTQVYEKVYGGTILVVTLVLLVEGAFALLQRRLVSPGLRHRRDHGSGRRSPEQELPVSTEALLGT